jgi:predicted HAD superfamily Cof-like phosphohydrolase
MADVKAFHQATDNPVIETPGWPSQDRIDLRNRLLTEEYEEYLDAVGVGDLAACADALGDMIYIICGTAHEFGIPLEKVWDAIQAANMQKVDAATGKVRKREDGKILKPAGWTPPDIARILAE